MVDTTRAAGLTGDDLRMLSAAERDRLLRLLTSMAEPLPPPPRARRRRALLLTVTSGGALVLLPWVIFLALSLTERPQGGEWRVAWVGFDLALAIGLGATAVLGWLRREAVVIPLVVTGVLLCCDAWFDLTLSWGTDDQWTSVATALLVEIPLAVLMFGACRRLLRSTVHTVRRREGRRGPVPPLHTLPLLLDEQAEPV